LLLLLDERDPFLVLDYLESGSVHKTMHIAMVHSQDEILKLLI